ncbi:MAG TPA: radical SAM protein [Thermoproteales archaeon]|nr:radical SAM protein [Thermoproteales archaeon]
MYRAWAKGRRIRLFKVLFSTACKNSCKYCAIRRGRKAPRVTWNSEKLVKTFLTLYRKGRVEGFFLSSGVFRDHEEVVEKEVEVATKLKERGFKGYISLRLMPGTPSWLIKETSKVADRTGVNIEAPLPEIFYEIAPDKGSYRNDILKVLDKASRIQPKSGVVTQMIIGLGETDRDVLYTTYRLLKDFKLRRVYYSPFKPVKDTPLENVKPCPSYRSKLLYQAFFLLRDYVFELKDLVSILDDNEMLPKTDDLKTYLAKKVDLKVDLDSASLKDILKIPGIGLKTAKAIIKLRDNGLQITPYVLKRLLGVSRFKKVVNFIDYKNTKLLAK